MSKKIFLKNRNYRLTVPGPSTNNKSMTNTHTAKPKGYQPMSDPTEVLRNMSGYAHDLFLLRRWEEAEVVMKNIELVKSIWATQQERGW